MLSANHTEELNWSRVGYLKVSANIRNRRTELISCGPECWCKYCIIWAKIGITEELNSWDTWSKSANHRRTHVGAWMSIEITEMNETRAVPEYLSANHRRTNSMSDTWILSANHRRTIFWCGVPEWWSKIKSQKNKTARVGTWILMANQIREEQNFSCGYLNIDRNQITEEQNFSCGYLNVINERISQKNKSTEIHKLYPIKIPCWIPECRCNSKASLMQITENKTKWYLQWYLKVDDVVQDISWRGPTGYPDKTVERKNPSPRAFRQNGHGSAHAQGSLMEFMICHTQVWDMPRIFWKFLKFLKIFDFFENLWFFGFFGKKSIFLPIFVQLVGPRTYLRIDLYQKFLIQIDAEFSPLQIYGIKIGG